jgi:hypothetical protein
MSSGDESIPTRETYSGSTTLQQISVIANRSFPLGFQEQWPGNRSRALTPMSSAQRKLLISDTLRSEQKLTMTRDSTCVQDRRKIDSDYI